MADAEHDQRSGEVDEVGLQRKGLAEEQDAAHAFQHEGERVEIEQAAHRFRHLHHGIEDRAHEHDDGPERLQRMRQVADEGADRAEDPAETRREQDEGQHQHRNEQRAHRQAAGDDQDEDEQQQEIDAELEQRRADQNPAENVDRKDDLGDIGPVLADDIGRPRDDLHEEAEHDQPGKEDQRHLVARGRRDRPGRLEDDAEDEGVDGDQSERHDHHPGQAEHAAAERRLDVARQDAAVDLAVAPDRQDGFAGDCERRWLG